jgi:peptidoglycan hydrolase-like protein with peptidoglycan-binding domain
MEAVKDYLTWLKDRPYAGTKLQANSTPWIMAVQIALESKGFDAGKIDGIF